MFDATNKKIDYDTQKKLIWGIIGVFFFMVGDGVEQAFLSKYIIELGFSISQSAFVFSVYGITVAIASWLSAVLSEMFGPRRVMLVGLIIWVVLHIGLLTFGLGARNYEMIVLMYGLRGFGYPLFVFSFFVWIAYVSPSEKLGTIMGWFWFAFSAGLGFVGAYYPSFSIPYIGYMGTLWSSLVFIIIGGLIGVMLVRANPDKNLQETSSSQGKLKNFIKGATIIFQTPTVGIAGIVRIINTAAQYGFVVILPLFFTNLIGFTVAQWLQIWGSMAISNMVFNVIWGYVGDKVGRQRVITWFGGVGCAITTLLFYYLPLAVGEVFWVGVLVSVLYGITLAAFVPLSALTPALAPSNKGAALSVLNLGAGLSTCVGPFIVGLVGGGSNVQAVMWTFAVMYILAAILTQFLKVSGTNEVSKKETA
ncbi:MFS transporter [Peribacillus simplex]